MSSILEDLGINDMGNVMRSKRNTDFYAGGIEVTEKECIEYLEFADKVLSYASPITDIRATAWYRKEVLYNISKSIFE